MNRVLVSNKQVSHTLKRPQIWFLIYENSDNLAFGAT
jgi:hypothetical protein